MTRKQINSETSSDLLAYLIICLNDGCDDAMKDAQEIKEEIYMRGNLEDIKYADWLYDVI